MFFEKGILKEKREEKVKEDTARNVREQAAYRDI